MKKLISVTLLICLLLAVAPAGAQDAVYCFSADPVNAGKDTGYAKADPVTLDDPHFGWALGHFLISGFSARSGDGGLVFERRPGVPLTLSFALEQDIDALNGDRRLSVSADKNGYDQLFGIKKIGFGRGALIIRRTDQSNMKQVPWVLTDFLRGRLKGVEYPCAELNEAGEYEVALDYELRRKGAVFSRYSNYRVAFRFTVLDSGPAFFGTLGQGAVENRYFAPDTDGAATSEAGLAARIGRRFEALKTGAAELYSQAKEAVSARSDEILKNIFIGLSYLERVDPLEAMLSSSIFVSIAAGVEEWKESHDLGKALNAALDGAAAGFRYGVEVVRDPRGLIEQVFGE